MSLYKVMSLGVFMFKSSGNGYSSLSSGLDLNHYGCVYEV